MKKYAIISLVLVLTAALLTGCGCTPMDTTTRPSATTPMLPTNIPETTVPTEPVTEPATVMPTVDPTEENSATGESGAIDETTDPTDMNRSRMR